MNDLPLTLQAEDVAGSFLLNVLPYMEIIKDGAPPLPPHCRGPARWDNPRRANKVVTDFTVHSLRLSELQAGAPQARSSSTTVYDASLPWSLAPVAVNSDVTVNHDCQGNVTTCGLRSSLAVSFVGTKLFVGNKLTLPFLWKYPCSVVNVFRTTGLEATGFAVPPEAQLVVVDKAYEK